jgi:hypothetical protein
MSTIVYLIGHYGVGKLTVARALCARTGARLFDNHLINNVVFSLIRADGKTRLPPRVWDFVRGIRAQAVAAIDELAAPELSYVLTNALTDDPMDRAAYDQIEALAQRRGSLFVPVVLDCSEAENARRVADPGREAGMKHTDPHSAMARRRTVVPLPVIHPNRLDLDNTALSPEAAADAILAHIQRLST